jgi:hypothetical protein
LAVGAGRIHNRWKQIEQHRRELKAWSEVRKKERQDKGETTDVPPTK